jgi:GNAT superfamily N-acetyltransferase
LAPTRAIAGEAAKMDVQDIADGLAELKAQGLAKEDRSGGWRLTDAARGGRQSPCKHIHRGGKLPLMSPLPPAPQRLACVSDAPRLSELMRASVLDLFPRFYDEQQTASAAVHIAHLDMKLIEDGTYFVHEAADEIVACGGWSRRAKLYTGSGAGEDDDRPLDPQTESARVRAMFVRPDWTRRGLGRAILDSCERAACAAGFRSLVLGATLPGEPLYRSYGFREVERFMLTMPDGVAVDCVAMERPIGA